MAAEGRFILMRHGDAMPKHPDGDRYRCLSPHGKLALAWQADRFLNDGLAIADIVHSPFVRTQQSASCLREKFPEASSNPHRDLSSGSSAEEVQSIAKALVGPRLLALIGHNPEVAYAANLLGGGPSIQFLPGTAVLFDYSGGECRMVKAYTMESFVDGG